jgi:hypothetical protein
VARKPLRLGRDAPSKLAARRISEDEVRALLDDHVVVEVVEERNATGTSCSAASVAVR